MGKDACRSMLRTASCFRAKSRDHGSSYSSPSTICTPDFPIRYKTSFANMLGRGTPAAILNFHPLTCRCRDPSRYPSVAIGGSRLAWVWPLSIYSINSILEMCRTSKRALALVGSSTTRGANSEGSLSWSSNDENSNCYRNLLAFADFRHSFSGPGKADDARQRSDRAANGARCRTREARWWLHREEAVCSGKPTAGQAGRDAGDRQMRRRRAKAF